MGGCSSGGSRLGTPSLVSGAYSSRGTLGLGAGFGGFGLIRASALMSESGCKGKSDI